MALGYCTVRVNIGALIIDGIDEDDVYEDVPVTGNMVLTPMLDPAKPVQVDDNGVMKIKAISAFPVDIGLTGSISHRNRDYVAVPAPTGLTSNLSMLQWRATFNGLKYGLTAVTVPPIYFWAEPGLEINLADHINVGPNSTALQLSRGPRGFGIGGVAADGGDLVFTSEDATATELGRVPLPMGGVADGGVTSAKLADAAVSSVKLAADAVTRSKLAVALRDELDGKAAVSALASKADVSALASKADVSALAAKADVSALSGKLDKTEAASTYVPVPAAPGTTGQVLSKTSGGTEWIAPPAGGSGAAIPPDLDALAKLDFRTNAPVTVAIAADSTVGFSAEKWYQLGWKELMAELWPERAAECIAWNPTPDAYDPPITWQLGTGGSGTEVQTIGQDTFTRTGALTASTPTVGNGTWLTTGGSAAATNGTRLVRTTTTPILTAQFQLKPRIGLDGTWGGKLYMASNLGVGSNTIMYGPYVTSQNFIRLLFTVSAAGVTKIEVRKTIGGTNTLIGSFPLQTWPDNSAVTELAFSINVTGTALTCTVNGATVTGTLTAGDVTALTSADQNFSFSTEHTAFEMDDLLVTGNVSAAGGSSLPKTTVYNAAVGGSTAAYQLARLNAMYPVRPDLMFLSHGHNYGSSVTTANFLAAIDEFMAAFLAKYPGVPIVVFSQNPRFAPATNLESHGDKQRALRAYAVSKGWHYIADYEAWEARPDRGSALMSVDGIHPAQPAGGRFGADQLKKWVKARSARVVV